MQQQKSILMFSLAGQLMGIPVLNVFEVIRPQVLNRVSDSSGAILGVINFHGHTISVLSLQQVLSLNSDEETSEEWIVVKYGSTYVGLAVDTLHGFVRPEEEVIDSSSGEFGTIADKISFFFRSEGSVIPVLAIDSLVKGEIETQLISGKQDE